MQVESSVVILFINLIILPIINKRLIVVETAYRYDIMRQNKIAHYTILAEQYEIVMLNTHMKS